MAGLSLLTATRRGGFLDWDLQVWDMRLWICDMLWMRVLARCGSIFRGGISVESVDEGLGLSPVLVMLGFLELFLCFTEVCLNSIA